MGFSTAASSCEAQAADSQANTRREVPNRSRVSML
jgi:hypothetical protein